MHFLNTFLELLYFTELTFNIISSKYSLCELQNENHKYHCILCKLQKSLSLFFKWLLVLHVTPFNLFERYRNVISKEICSFNTDVSKYIPYLAQQSSM